jgi:aspartate aminotransferase-like enzyme
VALASVQKCLALPPGLAVCAVSARALERSRSASAKGYYFDFVRLKGFFDKRMPMATPSVGHILALQTQLRRFAAEGIEARYARHRAMGAMTRAWAERRLGLFAADGARSETVTCVETRGLPPAPLLKAAAARGYAVGSGYGRLKESTFRIGHMGDHTTDGVAALLGVLDELLAEGGR